MKQAKFTRKKEDFICEVCGTHVHGNGYTNHCPKCLSSKHVDINPGDRACSCHGIMYPTGFELRHGTEYVKQTCTICGFSRWNKISSSDEREAVMALSNGTISSYLVHIQTSKK